MRIAVIGQRGVGKSAFLGRVRSYLPSVLCLDLDREIEMRTGKTVREIFTGEKEIGFRKVEREVFIQIDRETKNKDVFLALGGGFDPEAIPLSWQVLWLRRPSDEMGRIFLDRPQLDPTLSSLDEFFKRARERERKFSKRADQTLWLDEGLDQPEPAEQAFVKNGLQNLGGVVTFLPDQLSVRERWVNWLESRINFGVKLIELRDDLLRPFEIEEILNVLPEDRALVSFRVRKDVDRTRKALETHRVRVDWPIEFGPCPLPRPYILSSHQRASGQSLAEALAVFPEVSKGTQLKAALPVFSFAELLVGDKWRGERPEARNFLPMSENGRWSWYRQLRAKEQNIGFFRDGGEGSSGDQPTLLQWARARKSDSFAAVLGDPVRLSRTPMMQREFFAQKNAAVFAIQLNEAEWNEGFKILEQMGLRWAAVTAPLKSLAFDVAQNVTEISAELKTANTLLWEKGAWRAHNSDLDGLRATIQGVSDLGEVAVWGGGGTLPVVRKVLPEAHFYSARSGAPRKNEKPSLEPNTVIWAVGRAHTTVAPPATWRPILVIDLHYNDDSPARDFAKAVGSRYISGLTMFQEQAKAQQRFWNGEFK